MSMSVVHLALREKRYKKKGIVYATGFDMLVLECMQVLFC